MGRPFPVQPRGPRNMRTRSTQVLLACPRLSPEWELRALRALMKPQTGKGLERRPSSQSWPACADEIVADVSRELARRLDFQPTLVLHAPGDFHLLAEIDPRQFEQAKAFAAVLSVRLPTLWFTLGRLQLNNGVFHRRERGYKLALVPASNVHLRRDLRAAMRDLL